MNPWTKRKNLLLKNLKKTLYSAAITTTSVRVCVCTHL